MCFVNNVSSLCRVCGQVEETVVHIVAECSKLAQCDYKKLRHDNVAKVIHWKLCGKWGFERDINGIHTYKRRCWNRSIVNFNVIFHYRQIRSWNTTDRT